MPEFLAWIGDPSDVRLMAHHAGFDAGFLGRELARLGLGPIGLELLDTLALARKLRPDLPSHRLDALAGHFRLALDAPHRALGDSLRVRGLFLALTGGIDPGPSAIVYPIHDPRRGGPVPSGWDDLARAMADRRRVRIVYAGGSRGEAPREITPRRFAHLGGVAYVVALCHLSAVEKTFRLDRVIRLEEPPPP